MPLHHCVSQAYLANLSQNVAESAIPMTAWPGDLFAPTYQPCIRHSCQPNISTVKRRKR